MSNIIDNALKPTSGYVMRMTRDTVNGRYDLEVGIPNNWVFSENDDIKCEILNEFDAGKIIKISPKNDKIIVDELFHFVELIIMTNEKIAIKEKEFTDKMNEMKNVLENEAKSFYEELDKLKENSFKDLGENKEKKRRGRPPKKQDNLPPKETITITNEEKTTTKDK